MNVTLGSIFTDNVVLQQSVPRTVCGKADPGEQVSISFGRRIKLTEANATGEWLVHLDPLTASSEPTEVRVTGNSRVAIKNVFVGEVWLRSGQSNMEWTLADAANAEMEISEAQFAAIRYLLTCLIQDWRTRWGLGDFPFLIVQLPNFRELSSYEPNSRWAVIRGAQAHTTCLPNVFVVPVINLGEAHEPHPLDKRVVDQRAAATALANVYGAGNEWSDPDFRSASTENGQINLRFKYVGGGLSIKGSPHLIGFVICRSDRKFAQANARIEAETVIVSYPNITEPLVVRYAWANNPDCNLSNRPVCQLHPLRPTASTSPGRESS